MENLAKQILGKYNGKSLWKNRPENWTMKVVALFFALFLWYFVAGEDKVDVTVYVPIEIINMPHELVISNQFKKQLEVTLTGPRGLTSGLSKQHITRSVDMSKAKPGTQVVRNTIDSINFPRGIKVQRIQPSSTTLLIDRLIEKELAINPTLIGKTPTGYELVSTVLDPPTITLYAPEEILKGEVFLSTKPIDISGITESTQKQVALDLKPEIAELIGESVVSANLVYREKMVVKLIKNINIAFTHSALRTTYKLRPSVVNIKAELPYGLSKKTSEMPGLFKAHVDADSLPPGRHKLKVQIINPKESQVIKIIPPEIEITISDIKPLMKRKPLPVVPKAQPSPTPAKSSSH